ncbi:DUF5700 domain-containing putative Zn-dependent protease [Halomonas sp.]|uniref:DUF5700 domain-containing putative Zn-dependent protease n=1 Tax=Halomonas sp. TaxID=1486246 RepID=UPI0025C1B640|nr:DUF5700 domain-containing putative Zn-dependent protease [Halomonas sp.]
MLKPPCIITIFGFLFIFFCCVNPVQTDSLDFSGVDHFLEITATLDKDADPDPVDWETLFDTPGYSMLTQSEFEREFFMESFRLVFMPSRQEELQKRLDEEKNKPPHFRFLHHYLNVKQHRQEVADFSDSLRVNAGELLDQSAEMARKYLPAMQTEGYIPVSFVVFANDARGYTPVVIDAFFAMELGEKLHYLIAHELHHFYRNQILAFDRDHIGPADADIVWVIDQIHAEGVADQIDKRVLISGEDGPMHDMADRWEEMVAEAPVFLKRMNEALDGVAAGYEGMGDAGTRLREILPMSGHPVGFYMTNLIIRELGKEKLIEQTGNPLAFFRLYNQAAQQATSGDPPVLSAGAMEVIGELESRYVIR